MTDKAFEDWWKLLKPAECDEVEEHFRECWKVATAAARKAAQPAWHDAPTEAGLWVNNRNMSAYKISAEHIRRGVFNARWFGPIPLPEDTE